MPVESEDDMRFVYCGCVIQHILRELVKTEEDFLDRDSIIEYISSCQNYEGGFGWNPFSESHAGLTYCAVGSLKLIKAEIPNEDLLLDFIAHRHVSGFEGRIDKYPDTCYSFWNLGALSLIDPALVPLV